MEEFLTKEELSSLLKVTERTIDNLRRKGLPYILVGDNVRFEKEKALQWLEESKKRRGITKYRGHHPGHIRDPLLEAFEETSSFSCDKDWWEALSSPEEALKVLGHLWNCSDIVPHDVRDQAADWLESEGYDEEIIGYMRSGCTFAYLVRRLKPALLSLIEEQKSGAV